MNQGTGRKSLQFCSPSPAISRGYLFHKQLSRFYTSRLEAIATRLEAIATLGEFEECGRQVLMRTSEALVILRGAREAYPELVPVDGIAIVLVAVSALQACNRVVQNAFLAQQETWSTCSA